MNNRKYYQKPYSLWVLLILLSAGFVPKYFCDILFLRSACQVHIGRKCNEMCISLVLALGTL